jgi:5-methylcytosine-specific restriction endonuclease McrA
VEREARKRDGDRCQWPLDSGGICGSRFQIQLDHIIPKARGGRPVIGNLRLLCEPHNKLAAWQKLGHGLMNRYCRDPRLHLFAGLPGDTSGG